MASSLLLLVPLLVAQASPPVAPGAATGSSAQLQQALDAAAQGDQAAQAQRDLMIDQLAGMQDQVAGVREQLAQAEEERRAREEQQAATAQAVGEASDQMRSLLSDLAYGNTGGADSVLALAAQAAAAAGSSSAQPLIASAGYFLSQGDVYNARRVLAAAVNALSGQQTASVSAGY